MRIAFHQFICKNENTRQIHLIWPLYNYIYSEDNVDRNAAICYKLLLGVVTKPT